MEVKQLGQNNNIKNNAIEKFNKTNLHNDEKIRSELYKFLWSMLVKVLISEVINFISIKSFKKEQDQRKGMPPRNLASNGLRLPISSLWSSKQDKSSGAVRLSRSNIYKAAKDGKEKIKLY